MKWIVGVFIALCCLTRRAHNGFIKAEVSFGWQWVNGPCAVFWQHGIRLPEEERFLMSAFIRRSARVIRVSATSEQICNWCWDSPGVPPGSTLGDTPPPPPPLITEDNTESRMKGGKRDKRYPRRRIRFNFGPLSPASYVSFLPAGVIALPTRREAGIRCRGGAVVQEMSSFVSWFAWMLQENGR